MSGSGLRLDRLAVPLLLAGTIAPVVARAQDGTSKTGVVVGQPAGFDQLASVQQAVVDVQIGGWIVGQAQIIHGAGRLTFVDVDAVIALIPDLRDPAAIRAVLAAPDLDAHAELVCAADAVPTACATLQPAVAGVVFDEPRFRVDIVVNSSALSVHAAAERHYLPPPSAGLSLVDQFGGTIAGSGGTAEIALNNRAILGYRNARLRNEMFYSSRFGLVVDTLAAELDKPGVRYAAGALWAPGIDLTGRRKIVGAGVQSQQDTRLDRMLIAGSPLVVSLAVRSRVDILREGRLVSSRTYDAGNHALDSSSLPDGAYEVILRIQEAGGAVRDERRFFTKDAAIAAVGEPIFFAYAGLLANDRRGTPVAVSRTPFYEAGVARRLSPHVAVDATLLGTDRTAMLELGGYWLGERAQIRGAALASVRRDAGLLVQISSPGSARLNYTLDARRVWSRRDRPLIPLGDLSRGYDVGTIDSVRGLGAGSFVQVYGTLSYTLRPGQIGVTGFYRDDARASRSYGIGPTLYVPLIERGGLQVSLRGDMTLSNRGRSAFFGLSLQRLRGASSTYANTGIRTISGAGGGARDGGGSRLGGGTALVGGIGGAWQRDGVLGGNVALSGGLEREVYGALARGHADLRTRAATVSADLAQPVGGRNGATQYALGFQTTAAVSGQGLAFEGRERSDSVILVGVEGAGLDPGATFELLIDGTVRGVVRPGRTASVPVPAYRRYAVRIRSTGADLVHVDGGARDLSVYPGTVARASWTAYPVVAMFGRIVHADGTPMANAAVHAGDAIGTTDDNGYFQIEAGVRTTLKVQTADGGQCRLPVAAAPGAEGYAAIGTLICVRAFSSRQMADSTP